MSDNSNIKEKIESIFAAVISTKENKNSNLLIGMSGMTMALFYAAKQALSYQKKADDFLKIVFRKIYQQQYFSFSNGLAGIGWTLEHLEQKEFTK